MKRPLDDARQIFGAIDPVHALAEGPEDLKLVGVLVQVHFLMRMAPVEIRRHVTRDHDHRNGIERGVGDAGGGVGQPGAQMGEDDAHLARGARVSIGGMGRHLLMAGRDVADAALAERIQKADDRVAAEAKDHLDAEALEIIGEQIRCDSRVRGRRNACCSWLSYCAHRSLPADQTVIALL